MLLIDSSLARVRAFLAAELAAGRPRVQLAGAAGIAPGTLRGFERDDWSPTARTLRKLESLIPTDPSERRAA